MFGKGKMIWNDNSIVEDDFFIKKGNGSSVHKWSNGCSYSSSWKNNKMDGFDKYVFH